MIEDKLLQYFLWGIAIPGTVGGIGFAIGSFFDKGLAGFLWGLVVVAVVYVVVFGFLYFAFKK